MTFKDYVRKSHFYFKEVKLPSPETMDIWIEEVGKLPDEFYEWAFNAAKNREKKLPQNLPAFTHSLWQEWLRYNPKKSAPDAFQCHEACFNGWIGYFAKDGPNGTYRPVRARCGECQSIDGYARVLTVRQIEAEGWLVATAANCRLVSEHDRNIGLELAAKYQSKRGIRLPENRVDETLDAMELERKLFGVSR